MCPSFISVIVIKYPDENQLRKKGLFLLTIPGHRPSKQQTKPTKTTGIWAITSRVSSGLKRISVPCLGNGTAQGGLGTSIN